VYGAADNDVTVLGETSFTRTDGSTGTVGDVALRTEPSIRTASPAQQPGSGLNDNGLANAMVAASLVVAAGASTEHPATLGAGSPISGEMTPALYTAQADPAGSAPQHLPADETRIALPADQDTGPGQLARGEHGAEQTGTPPASLDGQHASDLLSGGPAHVQLSESPALSPLDAFHAAPLVIDRTSMPAIMPIAAVGPGAAQAGAPAVDAPATSASSAAAAITLADALPTHGTGPDIDTLLAALPGGGGNDRPAVAILAPQSVDHGVAGILFASNDHFAAMDLSHMAHDAVMATSHA
jgi:hypothetical protein